MLPQVPDSVVVAPVTPSGDAKRLLKEMVMTPPKTPPPAGLTPKKAGPGGRFFPAAGDRLSALRVETGAGQGLCTHRGCPPLLPRVCLCVHDAMSGASVLTTSKQQAQMTLCARAISSLALAQLSSLLLLLLGAVCWLQARVLSLGKERASPRSWICG